MHTTTETWAGRIVLLLCNVAGLLDLVILPLWVGGLIGTYKLAPQMAGGLVTLYLVGVLISNAVLAFRFDRVPLRTVAATGFLVPAVAFVLMTRISDTVGSSGVALIAILNFVGGLGAGAGMAIVHGMIGRSSNPHRLFAFANFGLTIFGVVFFLVTPPMMVTMGVNAVFLNVGILIAIAFFAVLLAFPKLPSGGKHHPEAGGGMPRLAVASTATLAICFAGIVFLQIGNAVTLSFVERVGNFRGFDSAAIGLMLSVGGLVVILAPIAAAILQKKLNPVWVVILGMMVHAALSATLSNASSFLPYAIAYASVVTTVVFTHTFAFGLLARIDPSARMNALTPTMMMSGSAIGPFLGGTVVQFLGFPQVGIVAAICAMIGALCYLAVVVRLQRLV